MMQIRRTAAALTATAALSLSGVAVATPAQAAPQFGLVNVNIEDVTVQVPVAAAANLCGIQVAVLAAALLDGPVECDAQARSRARR